MPKTPEQRKFSNIYNGRISDPDHNSPELETVATEQEIEWIKGEHLWRARQHAQAGQATLVELRYLAENGFFYPTTPKQYRPKKEDKN